MHDLEFPLGLPAFETLRHFRLNRSSKYAELLFLESKENPEVSLPLVPMQLLDPDYQLAMSEEDRAALGLADTLLGLADTLVDTEVLSAQILCLAIVTAYEDSPPTANLLAPVVVNLANGRAVQSVRSDALYSHKHPLIRGPECS
jgi:flagellar assembly factor FliW